MLPDIQYEPTGAKKNGRALYCVTKGGVYLWKNHMVVIPSGMITDLASIPPAFFLLKPHDTRWDIPAIIHDMACHDSRRGKLSADYKIADDMFYDAMRERGASKFWAYSFWAFVRANHRLGL